jgi:tripeptidyl-peptidase-1
MKSFLLTVIVGLVAQTIAAPAPAPVSHIVHEKRDIDSSTWILNDIKLRRDAIIPMSIGLTQRNLEHGYDFLMDVSDPKSPNYGKHWTMEKVLYLLSRSLL